METTAPNTGEFDQTQSLRVIREMIEISQKKLKNDGILFILWGYLMFINYAWAFIERQIIITYPMRKMINFIGIILAIFGFGFTFYYIFKHSRKVQTYIGISLRYVWVSFILCLSFTNMIIFNVTGTVNFQLQHPLFMLFTAFATVITGSLLRYPLIIIGGIVFGVLAYISSFLTLENQLILDAAAWVIAFVIPGHIMYSKRNN